jgi:hypothetical protein
MPDAEGAIPEAVRRLLAERIDSIAQLELLLLLHRSAPEPWDAQRVAAELRLEPAWAEGELAELCRRGLCAEASADAPSYRFHPASSELEKAVATLAACYGDRRVTIIGLIYGRPNDPIRQFADAFRIRREDPDG